MDAPDNLIEAVSSSLQIGHAEAEQVWQEFFPRLMRFAKTRIGDMQSGEFDEEDIALSALKSFYRAAREGRVAPDQGNDELWRLLVKIAARKLTAQRRRMNALKRGGAAAAQSELREQDGLAQLLDKNRMPESTTAIFVACEELLAKLKDEKLRRTAIMRMEGYSNREIADRLECSVARTKQRIAKIKQIWSAGDV